MLAICAFALHTPALAWLLALPIRRAGYMGESFSLNNHENDDDCEENDEQAYADEKLDESIFVEVVHLSSESMFEVSPTSIEIAAQVGDTDIISSQESDKEAAFFLF